MIKGADIKIYVFKKDYKDGEKGMRLFLQDGMYYYKTITDQDRWLSIKEVESNKEVFENISSLINQST